MSAKTDFRQAHTHVHNAWLLSKPHLDPYLYAALLEDLEHLMQDLDVLAIEGAIQPITKPP